MSKISKISDDELKALFHRVRNGDADAYNNIFKQFRPFFNSITYQFIKNGLDQTDIMNEIMSITSTAIIDYDETKDPSPIRHLTCRVRYGVWNYYTKQMLYFRTPRPIFVGNISDFPETEGVTYENLILDKLEVEEALEALTDKQRQIIKMYFWDQMTQDEIAQELNVWQTAVSWNLKRSLRILKKFFLDRELGYN